MIVKPSPFRAPTGPYVHQDYPKYVEHATEKARVVANEAAHRALGPGWGLDDLPPASEPVSDPEPPVHVKRGRKAKDAE